jgi:hypothetical protein
MLETKTIFTKIEKRNKTSYVINGHNILFLLATISLVILFANVVYLCSAMFSCRKFIPTISYTGCFLGLDRHMELALTILLPVLVSV